MIKKNSLNWKYVLHLLSMIIILEAIFMVLTVMVSIDFHEKIEFEIIFSFFITLFFGIILYHLTKTSNKSFFRRETYMLVTLSWVTISLFGTLPYLLTDSIPDFTNAFFESVSGFTTTGSSILTDIESLPKSILFWRSETHWIGGMGIIILFVALFPNQKNNRIYLFNAEASVVVEQKIFPKWITIARWLWFIYVLLTITEAFLLHLGGMSTFDSICHSFATVATGGFSTKNASIAAYNPYIQYVITIFMILSGTNFTVYLLILRKKFGKAIKDTELKTFYSIIFVSGFILTFILYFKLHKPFEEAFRESFFQVASIITATGFATTDYYNLWPVYAWFIIVILMLIGASSGSTGGGVKVIRYVIFFKKLKSYIKEILHPNLIPSIKYNGKNVSPSLVHSVTVFILFYFMIIATGTIALMLLNVDGMTAFGSVLTAMGGMGPGLGLTGPAGNFSMLPVLAKIILSFLMIVGRLEIFTVLTLFTRAFYKG